MTQQEQQYYRWQMLRRQSLLRAYNNQQKTMAAGGCEDGGNSPVQEEIEVPVDGLTIPASVIPPSIATITLKNASSSESDSELKIVVESVQQIDEYVLGFIFKNSGDQSSTTYLKPYLNSEFTLCSTPIAECPANSKIIERLKFTTSDHQNEFIVFAENDILKKQAI